MKRAGLFTFCLILILSIFAQAQEAHIQTSTLSPKSQSATWKAWWRMRLAGSDIRDERAQSKLVDIRTDIKALYKLTNDLIIDVQPLLRLQSGQFQSFNGADSSESKIMLNQAALHYQPVKMLKLSGGALNQRYLHSDLFMDYISFPSARLEIQSKLQNWTFAALGESAIPTSTSLSTNTKELEKTPSLNTVGLRAQWRGARNLNFKLTGAYYQFENLPSTVAQASGMLGNDIVALSEADFEFLHQHRGYQGRIEMQFPLSRALEFKVGADYIRNIAVSEELGLGYKVFHETRAHLKGNMDLIFKGSYFSLAPESAVGYFNANWYETNRIGYSAETALAFNKEKFEIGIRYMDSEVMFINAVQSREKTWFIKLETFYADI